MNIIDTLPELMTVRELQEALKVSRSTIHRAIKSGKLKAFKVGRNVRVEKTEVKEWLQEL